MRVRSLGLTAALALLATAPNVAAQRREGDTTAAPPQTLLREVFAYEGGGRDPFMSLLKSGDVRPLISDLKLTTVVYDGRFGSRSVAVLRDITNRRIYRVKTGDIIGRLKVTQIRPREVPLLRRRLGIVFQDFRLLEDRTAEENVAFALEVTGARRSTIAARVMRVLTQVGLAAKAQAYSRELSGGEQQRVAIARALVNEPTVLLADEPTGNLDDRATRGVFQLLRDINASGTAVAMATHDLDLVRQAPYRVIELQEGALVYDSAVDEPRDQAASP